MTGQTWLLIGVSAVAGIGLGAFILTRTNWFKVRKYAVDMKRVYDQHKDLQQKSEQLQSMGPNANPLLMKKHLRELIATQQAMVTDMEKVKAPGGVKELHGDTLTMHRESLELYQMMLAGGVGQKALQGRQQKLMKMQTALQGKTEKIYGKPPEKKVKK